MDEVILSIDFGSAYTKIALRRGFDSRAELLEFPRAAKDEPLLTPSVVALDTRGDRERWLVGVDAARSVEGEGVAVYRNFKSQLYEADVGSRTVVSGGVGPEHLVARFFAGLRESLPRRLRSAPVRLSVPKLDGHGTTVQESMTSVLESTGFSIATERPLVHEPEANTIGMLTRGRNETWTPPLKDFQKHRGREGQLALMLDDDLTRRLQAMRQGARYPVLLLDVGAFTTDFGYVSFDESFREDLNKPKILQESVKLGVAQLDDRVRARLNEESRNAIGGLSPAEWDRHKRALYRGDSVELPVPGGGLTRIGAGVEQEMIVEEIAQFVEEIWAAKLDFCASNDLSRIEAQFLSGGGALISRIREDLTNRVESGGNSRVFDLLYAGEPRRALGDRAHAREIEERRRRNQALVRGGSAIGGCSVFWE